MFVDAVKNLLYRFLSPLLGSLSPALRWMQKVVHHKKAVQANSSLLEDVRSIDASSKSTAERLIKESCDLRGFDESKTEDWLGHRDRLILSRQWLAACTERLSGPIRALDLGQEGVVSDYWRSMFPDIHWQNTDWDLRFPWKVENACYELITCTEVVEHISDPPDELHNEGFYRVGVKNVFRECYRVLKPGGLLFLTTPNAASINVLESVLEGHPPWNFPFHVREYTLQEMTFMLEQAGFVIRKARDVHCLSTGSRFDYLSMFQVLLEYEYPLQGRGDDIFLVAKKPQNPVVI